MNDYDKSWLLLKIASHANYNFGKDFDNDKKIIESYVRTEIPSGLWALLDKPGSFAIENSTEMGPLLREYIDDARSYTYDNFVQKVTIDIQKWFAEIGSSRILPRLDKSENVQAFVGENMFLISDGVDSEKKAVVQSFIETFFDDTDVKIPGYTSSGRKVDIEWKSQIATNPEIRPQRIDDPAQLQQTISNLEAKVARLETENKTLKNKLGSRSIVIGRFLSVEAIVGDLIAALEFDHPTIYPQLTKEVQDIKKIFSDLKQEINKVK